MIKYISFIIVPFNIIVSNFLQDTLEALKELSTFFNENSIRTRRNLRGEIEGRSLAINQVQNVYMSYIDIIPHIFIWSLK